MTQPLPFEVIGADGPKRYFGALTKETVAHAYVFSGPAGVGKKTFARRLAQSLLCEGNGPAALGYDGRCASCAMFAASGETRHPDFVESDGVLRIGEPGTAGFYDGDDLTSREIVRLFSMQSYVGGMRVLLLGDVRFASAAAANALLKFLEESPRGVVTVMTTAAPGSIIATIASRAIDVRFSPLSKDDLAAVLQASGYSQAQARRGAALGGGSVGKAIAALDAAEESLRAAVARWFLESAAGSVPERTWATRETLDEGLEIVKSLARDWIVAHDARLGSVEALAEDYAEGVRRLAGPSARRAVELLARLDDAARMAQTNVPPSMVADYVAMALAGAGEPTKTA
ncbi:MAG TPA: hypothetical protein VJP76_01400 [Candidatus Tumulicola sp.]|nr:hypothetical protein [Candidatus Tumulicola sp.]